VVETVTAQRDWRGVSEKHDPGSLPDGYSALDQNSTIPSKGCWQQRPGMVRPSFDEALTEVVGIWTFRARSGVPYIVIVDNGALKAQVESAWTCDWTS